MDSSDSSSSSDDAPCGEIPMGPYDLSKAIAMDSGVMDLLSEDARYFFKFSLHGPRPVMFYQYKYPLRLTSSVRLEEMRSSLNRFIMRKSKEEARITFYNGEARRQVQQAATNMDAETDYRLTLRKHVDLYGMESAAAELSNFMLTTAQRIDREVRMYNYILNSIADQETLSTLRFTKRSVLELSYAALLRMNLSAECDTFLLDKLLASLALEAAGTGDSGATGFFSLESAVKTPFLRSKFVDSEASCPSVDNPVAISIDPVPPKGPGSTELIKQDTPSHKDGSTETQPAADSVQEKESSEAASIQGLHHTSFQLFTEHVEKLLASVEIGSLLSDLTSYYDILSMYSVPETSTDSVIQSNIKTPKSVKNIVNKEDDLSSGANLPSASSNLVEAHPMSALLSRCEKYRTCPNLYSSELSVLFRSSLYQEISTCPLIDFSATIEKFTVKSAASTRRPSATIAPKTTTRGNSPSATRRSPSSTTSSKKASQTPVMQTPAAVSKEPSIDAAVMLDEGYLDYNQLFSVFKHIYHFYQYCVDPSRDVKLLRCAAMDPNFSLSEYVRSLASNGQNTLSQISIANAAFFLEFSSLLSKGSLENVDLLTDLLHPEQTNPALPSPLSVKQKGSLERPKSKAVTPPGSRVELEEYSNGASFLSELLNIELFSVGDLINYFRFLRTFVDDSYEVRAYKSLLKEIQDLVLLELWKSDNDTASIRNYLINKDSVPYAVLADCSLARKAKMPALSQDDNYFTLLLANLNNDAYIKMLIDKIDLIFVTGDPVSGKTLITTELSRRLSGERKIPTGIVDAYTIYRSLYEELMRILDDQGSKRESYKDSSSQSVYLEDELMSDLLTLHNNLLYTQLSSAQPGARFYPHTLHNPKSLSDGLILNSNSMASCASALDPTDHSADSPIQSLHQRAPGRSTLRDELPIDTDTLSSQNVSRTVTRDAMIHDVKSEGSAHAAIRHNISSGDNFFAPNELCRDGSLFSQNEGEITDEPSDASHQQTVRFNIPSDVQAMLRTPEQYMVLYRAIQRRVRRSLLSRTHPSELSSATMNSFAGTGDQSSELQEIERVDNGVDDLANVIESILSGKDNCTPDKLTVDVTDVHQINRFVVRSMLVQAITQSLLSNYTCLIFDGFPNSICDSDIVEDLLNGCLTKDSLQRLLGGYTSHVTTSSSQNINVTPAFCTASTLNDPLTPVFIKRSGMTSLIYLYDDRFESVCQRLYGRLFISSHPVECDDLFDAYLTNHQLDHRDPYNTELSINETQWPSKDLEICRTSTYINDHEESMTDDADNPKKQYFVTDTQAVGHSHQRKDYSTSSGSDFSPDTSMDYSSNEDESTDPDCERIRKEFPIGSEASSPQHSGPHTHTSPSGTAMAAIHSTRTSKSILYNSRRLNLSADNLAVYGAGLKVPAHAIRDIGFMSSATLDVLNTDPVKDSVLFGDDCTQPPVEIPLKPVAQWADLPTRNVSKANLSLLSVYTTTSLGFAPWADEKGDEHFLADDTFIKSYPIVDPQAYDAFCKAIVQSAVRLSTGCQHKVRGPGSPMNDARKLKPSIVEVFFSYLFFNVYGESSAGLSQHATPHKHEVARNLVQLNYENRLLINRVDIELASYKQKRDTLLAWMQHTYGDLQPHVSLPSCIQADPLFRRSRHNSGGIEVCLADDVDHEEVPLPSVLCVCNVGPLFSKALAAFSDGQSGNVFAEELAEIGNKVYHHVLRAIEHRKQSVSNTSYELQAMLPRVQELEASSTQRYSEQSSFATEFLELYQKELGVQTPSTDYLDHPIPEPPLDATDLKKAKPVPAKTQSNKAKTTPSDTAYVALNPLTTFNLPRRFFSGTLSNALQDITRGYKQRQVFMEQSVHKLTIYQSVMTDILTHESSGQTDLLTNFYDVSLEHTQATFVEFLNFYKSIDREARNQPNIKADALLLIDKCLSQCNDDIFRSKARSNALINELTTRYLRLSAKMSLDILSLGDYKDVVSRYLPPTTKDREVGIALGILLFQYVSSLYDILWDDVAYVSLVLFTLHEISLSAYDASTNMLYDLLAALSAESEQQALAEAYNTQLEPLLHGRQVTSAMIGQQLTQLKVFGRVAPPVLIIGISCLQEHVQQKNQKPYEGYAATLDPLYALAKSLAGSSNEHRALLLKMKERAVTGLGQDPILTVEEYAHYNYQAIEDTMDQLNDLVHNGMLISQGAGATVTRVCLHPVYNKLVIRIFTNLKNKLSFVKRQVQTYIAMCTDGLSNTLLKIGDMIDSLYASTLSVAASTARAMQTIVDKELDILDFRIDIAAKRINLEVDE
ncbi:Hypothetical protein GLP15_3237 [Giardia lamblia P15]|uniref:Uncharacterized protein n=1 Tax=Giardia intestinalis (strain P15) TaxID=658858 RepID=E1EWR5_GIAIA|nr:Hypothetical protein GLP15_3237 [Giardia lamblia P15]